MKIPVVLVSLFSSSPTLVPSANAAGFRDLVERVTRRKSNAAPTASDAATANDAAAAADDDADVAAGLQDQQEGRRLQGNNCWGDETPAAAWHPNYSAGWTNGHCRFVVDCNSPAYSSEAACCKAAYAGQVSGYCLMQLPSPPTTSPTDAGGLDVYYPDYDTAWPDAGCINERPMPSGRPTYGTLLACCKGAYGGQASGKCLSMLPSPPTTSPTTSGGMADFWYPDYETAWSVAGCSNKLPLPYRNKNDRPNYSSQIACCKGAYAGQMSGKCLSELAAPPTTSPTGVGGMDVWYPDYDTAWTEAGCINDSPLPSGRPTYDTRLACCKGAYGGQVSGKCLSQLASPPTTSPIGIGGADFYYRDYSKGWLDGTCINDLPLPIQVTEGRNTYSTEEECCKAAFGGQVSNACLCSLEVKPTVCYEVKTDTITSTVDPALLGVTVPATLPTGSALTSLVASLKNAIKANLNAAGTEVSDITIVSIGGVTVNKRRLGKVLALGGGRSLQSNTVVYKVEVEYSCLPEECTAKATEVAAAVDRANPKICKLPKLDSSLKGKPFWAQTGQVMTFFDASSDAARKVYTNEEPIIPDNDQYVVQCSEKGYIPDEACFYTCKDGILDETTYCSTVPQNICVKVRESTFSKQCPLDFDSDKPFHDGKSLKQWWKEVLDKYHFQRNEIFALESDVPLYLGHGSALLAGYGFTIQHFRIPAAEKEFNADAIEITGWISGNDYEYGEDTLRGSSTVEARGFVQDLNTTDIGLGGPFMLPEVIGAIKDFDPKFSTTSLIRDYDPCDDSKYLGFSPECFIYHPAGYHLGSGEMIMYRSPLSNGIIDLQGVCTGAETAPPILVDAYVNNVANVAAKVEKAGGLTSLHPASWSMHFCIDDDIYHPYLCSENVNMPSVKNGDYVPVDVVPFIPIHTEMRKKLCAAREAAGTNVCKPTTDTDYPYPWTQIL